LKLAPECAEIALAIFFVVFVVIGLRLLVPSQQWEHVAHLPLEDDTPARVSRPSRPARPTPPSPPALP